MLLPEESLALALIDMDRFLRIASFQKTISVFFATLIRLPGSKTLLLLLLGRQCIGNSFILWELT